jgi:hypothetical protein
MIRTLLRATALALTAFLATAALPPRARAADLWTAAKVGKIIVNTNGTTAPLPGWVSFSLENSPPLCGSGAGGEKTLVVLTPDYLGADAIKSILSTLTAAKLAGRMVQVRGLNSTATNGEKGCRLEGLDVF